MDSDRLRQSSFHGQAEGGPSSSSSGGLWAPGSWLRILAKLPRRLWGRSSCLNPVPQERHLLVIGTMEMAGWVLDLAPGSKLPRRQKGDRWDGVGQVSGSLCHLSLSPTAATSTRSKPAKSKVQPTRWERESLRGRRQ
jgi:hypothetical protein